MQLRELDERVTYMQQLQEDGGPVVLINVFNVAPEDAERLLEAWADDAAFMKQQPGFISTQLHRGTAGSSTFVNVAEWESARALGQAFLAALELAVQAKEGLLDHVLGFADAAQQAVGHPERPRPQLRTAPVLGPGS